MINATEERCLDGWTDGFKVQMRLKSVQEECAQCCDRTKTYLRHPSGDNKKNCRLGRWVGLSLSHLSITETPGHHVCGKKLECIFL